MYRIKNNMEMSRAFGHEIVRKVARFEDKRHKEGTTLFEKYCVW